MEHVESIGILQRLKEGLLRRPIETRQGLQSEQASAIEPIARTEASRKSEIRRFLARIRPNQTAGSATLEQPLFARPELSVFNRAANMATDGRITLAARVAGEWALAYLILQVASVLLASPLLGQLSIPITSALGAFRLINLSASRTGLDLNNQLSLLKKTALLPWGYQTPVGKITFGEQVGCLHLSKFGEIAKLSTDERATQLPLEAIKGLEVLREKVSKQNPDVAKIRVFEANSHLVAQNSIIFERLGFKLEPNNKSRLKAVLTTPTNIINKALFIAMFGANRFFRGSGIAGFGEANSIIKKRPRKAWITAEDLVNQGPQIQRLQRMIVQLSSQSKSAPNNMAVGAS
ncbi:hypothetical protein HY383_01410 [Candidatus Daviesbacteria bacterium]|nr:hypothetical protein [Candidatus Daviesbacteria bacterium]